MKQRGKMNRAYVHYKKIQAANICGIGVPEGEEKVGE